MVFSMGCYIKNCNLMWFNNPEWWFNGIFHQRRALSIAGVEKIHTCSKHALPGYPILTKTIVTLWWTNILPWKITIFKGKTHYFYGNFPLLFVCSPEGTTIHSITLLRTLLTASAVRFPFQSTPGSLGLPFYLIESQPPLMSPHG